jgi:Icc-related predicted phosphoesterase
MKILFLGDIHSDIVWIKCVLEQAETFGVDIIVQLGDLGYWEHKPGGAEMLDCIQELCDKYGIDFWWIDGNHENFDWLYDYPLDKHGRRPVRPNVIHVPRGHTWEWDGVKFLAFGGSFSINRDRLILGDSYWEQEMPTVQEVDVARKVGKVDVMVTHDVPEGTDLADLLGPSWKVYAAKPVECGTVRQRVRDVWDIAQPSWLFHGHYHRRADNRLGDTRIVGLSQERTGSGSIYVADTADLTNPDLPVPFGSE